MHVHLLHLTMAIRKASIAAAMSFAAAHSVPLAHLPPLAAQAQRRDASTSSKSYLGCAVYVSEARNAALLRQLESLARSAPGAHLANLFVDEPYNRSNFTFVGTSLPELAAAVVSLTRAALAELDLRGHAATHPRLGTVDHISCHPLGEGAAVVQQQGQQQQQQQGRRARAGTAGEDREAAEAAEARAERAAADHQHRQQQQEQQQQQAAELARAIAQQLGAGPLAVPVLTYGWAHPQGRRLDAIRRELGYFQGAAAGSWQGFGPLQTPAAAGTDAGAAAAAAVPTEPSLLLPLPPCFGPAAAPARSGVCCVGAGPWIVNYNVLLRTQDLPAARAVARSVSERGGGLPAVQAMALRHADGIEVACNLLLPAATPPAAVLAEVGRLAGLAGLEVGRGYRTNKAPEELVAAAAVAGL